MKSIALTILMFSTSLMFSQNNVGNDPRTGLESILFATINTNSVGIYFNKPKNIVGDIYVFKGWNNRSKIVIGDQVYKLSNINLNIKTDKFEAKVGKDSMFVFNTSNINHIFINNRKFKSFYFLKEDKNKNFEIIYDGKVIKILKGYEVGIKYNEPDPLMVKKNVDNYFTTVTYYIRKEEGIKQIKLKKKTVLGLLSDKASFVSKFVKENKLSYKNEKDINKIFIFYDSL